MFIDYYELLEITKHSTSEEIKSAYKKQAIKWHPDKNIEDTTKMMQLINEAKLILLDDEVRKRYDIEYLKFKNSSTHKESQKNKHSEPQSSRRSSKTYEYHDYTIKDDILEKWMRNARNEAKDIINETIELTKVGGHAALKEFISGAGCMIIGLLIIGMVLLIINVIG